MQRRQLKKKQIPSKSKGFSLTTINQYLKRIKMLPVRLNMFLYMPTIFLMTMETRFLNALIGLEITSCGRASHSPFFNDLFFQILKSFDLKLIMLPNVGFQCTPDSIIIRIKIKAIRWPKLLPQKFTAMLLQVSECNF